MGGSGVKYLLDTTVWLRAVNEKHTLPAKLLGLLSVPDEVFGLSGISLWEVGKKAQLGKLALPKDLPAWFEFASLPTSRSFRYRRKLSLMPCGCRIFPIATQPTN